MPSVGILCSDDEILCSGDEVVSVSEDELDAEDELDNESVDGVACAKPVPRPRAAKPREPAMAPVAASFLMLLMVVISVVFRSYAGPYRLLVDKGMAPTSTPTSAKRCVL